MLCAGISKYMEGQKLSCLHSTSNCLHLLQLLQDSDLHCTHQYHRVLSHRQKPISNIFMFLILFCGYRCLQGCRGSRREQGSAEPSSAQPLTWSWLKVHQRLNSVLGAARTAEESPNLQNSYPKKTSRQTNESYGAPTLQSTSWEKGRSKPGLF